MASNALFAEPPAPSYDGDLAAWAYHQAELLRRHRPSGVDWANIAEELKDLGNSQFKAFASALEVVIKHMLKWDMQPERRGASWASSIRTHRSHARYELRTNPSFKSRIDEALDLAWDRSVSDAAGEMEVAFRSMPRELPYSWDEIMDRPFEWPPEDQ